ncbi:leucine-rich repeat protein [Lapidilactobacillus wuchangensis]|uniref:leucine-rich repeat protein n=1 Tax=Lapidilactobacillus wuchangensis TaxID=2486001 RepID=UPI000F7A4BC7|nr:leucine-rich repeat protein [Lapidilactobacillus wuchangensis]
MKKRFISYECERVLLAILLGTAGVGSVHEATAHAATNPATPEAEDTKVNQTNQQEENKVLNQMTTQSQPMQNGQPLSPAQMTRSAAPATNDLSSAQKNLLMTYNDSNQTAIITGSNDPNFTALDIPDVVVKDYIPYKVVGIQNGAFANDANLQSVRLGANMRSIDANVFTNDTNLQSVDFSKTTDFFSIGASAFANTGLQTVTLPNTIQQIYPSAFANCQQLTQINLPDSLYNIGAGAFMNNTALQSIQIPASLRAIADQTFSGDSALNQVTFELGSQLTSIGDQAFANDTSLVNLQIPATVTSIGQESFYQCHALNTVNFVQNGQLTSIGDRAFAEDQLEFTLTLPDSLTTIGNGAFMGNQIDQLTLNNGLQTIGNSAFAYNRLEPSLTIPSSVISIGMSGFEGNQLASVSSGGPNLQIGPDAFSYNRLTNVTAGNVTTTGIASSHNNATTYTNNKQVTLGDLFKLNLDGQTDLEKNLQVSQISNGVSYANGIFTVPVNTADFSFAWTYNDHGVPLYSGDYEVDADTDGIKAYNTVIMSGTKWIPDDNTSGAVEQNGTVLTPAQLGVTVTNPQGQTVPYVGSDNQLGAYQVSYSTPQYSLGNGQMSADSADVNANIIKRQATYVLAGTQQGTYNGDAPTLNPGNYQLTLSNGDNYQLTNGDLALANNVTGIDAGTYQVVLSPQGVTNLDALDNNRYEWTASNIGNALLQVMKAPQAIVIIGSMSVPYNGQTQQPTINQFPVVLSTESSTSSDPDAVTGDMFWTLQPGDLVATSGQPLQNVGQYQLTLTPAALSRFLQVHNSTDNDWQVISKNNSYTITPAIVTIAANNLSKYAGEADPTLTSTITEATPVENGSPLNYSINRVAGEAPGVYPISITTGDNPNYQVTTTPASFTILANHESVSGQNATMYAGDPLPDYQTFAATATDQAGQATSVTADLSQVHAQVPGTYPVTLRSSTGETKQVTLQVLANQQSLTGQNVTMYVGDSVPTIADFKAQATSKSGQALTPSLNLSQANLTMPGTYPVLLTTTDGQQRQVELTVLANQQRLTAQNYQLYVNGTMPTVADFQAHATDKAGQAESVMADTSQVNLKMPGNYPVTLTTADGQKQVVTVQVVASQASISGQDATVYVGDPTPTISAFKATATDESGQATAITADLSQANLKTPGNYPITLTTTGGQTKVVMLHVLANDAAISGQNYQMYVGDPQPTSTDFQASAVAEDGTKIPVTIDLSQAHLNQPGTYSVLLSASNGETKTVELQVLANQATLTAQNYQMYTNGTRPTAANFHALATTRNGQPEPVQVDLSQANLTLAGNYPVTLTTADGQTKVVTLQVLTNQQQISGHDVTMYAGDPAPTINDFAGKATDASGQPASVTADLTGVNLQVPGNYPVTLTSSDGQTKVVTLHVLVNQRHLSAENVTMTAGDPLPTVGDFHVQATNEAGQPVNVQLNFNGANLQTPGSYPITLTTTDGQSLTVTVQVQANHQSLTGTDATIYTNGSQPVASTFKALATNKLGASMPVQVDLSQANLRVAGDYPVQLTTTDGQHKTVTLHVLADQQKINGQNATIYTTSATPTSATFAASATAINGQVLPVQVDLSKVNLHQAGNYPVLLTTSDGQSREVNLQVLANQQNISGHNAQMYVGETLPTVMSFAGSATDENGQPVSVRADLSQANLQKPGTYLVNLISSDGQTKMVTLTVLANQATFKASDYSTYTGNSMPTVADFQATATDENGQPISVTADFSQVDLNKAGTYPVVLTASNGQKQTVQLTVQTNQQGIHAEAPTMYTGNAMPTIADFHVTATDESGHSIPVTADLSQVNMQKAGTYPVVLTASDGQKLTVQMTVLTNQQGIHAEGPTMYTGNSMPTVAGFHATATDESGHSVPVTVDLSQVNMQKAGTYPVVLTAGDGQKLTVQMTVLTNDQGIHGQAPTVYTGNAMPTVSDFHVTATDESGHSIPVTAGFSQVNMQKAGTYPVILTASDGQKLTVQMTVLTNQQGIHAEGPTMYTGNSLPTVADFHVTATDESGHSIPVTADLSQVNMQKAGTYPVVLTASDGQKLTVQLSVLTNQQEIHGQAPTMYTGNTLPTVTDFHATATDESGHSIPVTVDLSQVNMQKAGTYPVVLTAGDGQKLTVQMTVLTNDQGIHGQAPTVYTGNAMPTVSDFHVTATDESGHSIAVTADLSQVNMQKAGTYPVALTSSDDQKLTVQMTVLANQQGIHAEAPTMYTGNTMPTVVDFHATATDESGHSIAVTADLSQVNMQKAGTYPVVLTANDGQKLTVQMTVLTNDQSIHGQAPTMYTGNSLPTVADFHVTATDESGHSIPVTADLSQVNMQKAGTYPVVLTASDGQKLTVQMTVLANQQRIHAEAPTVYTGNTMPTVADFRVAATDESGHSIPATADLSQVNMQKAGTYPVVLTASDGQKLTVQMTVLTNDQGIHGQAPTVYTGNAMPTVADFHVTATDESGRSIPVTADLSQVNMQKVGTYPVVLTASDGQKLTVQLTVLTNQQGIHGQAPTMYTGNSLPTIADFHVTATDESGHSIPVTADLSQVSMQKAGTYPVVLTASDGQKLTVQLTVLTNQQGIHGQAPTMYTSNSLPTIADFHVTATDESGHSIPVTADLSQVNMQKAGTYPVVLTASDGQKLTVQMTVLTNQQGIHGQAPTMYTGNSLPTVADFHVTATDESGHSIPVTADLSQVNMQKAGTYPVVLTASDGQKLTVQLIILANHQQIHGQGLTMYTGNALPTAADFQATATDESGAPISVTADLSQVDPNKVGSYPVVLHASNGQTLTVTLKILANRASLTAKNYTMVLGSSQPTLEDFQAVATDEAGIAGEAIQMNFGQVNFQKVGRYPVQLRTMAGQSLTVDLAIVAPTTTPTKPKTTGHSQTPTKPNTTGHKTKPRDSGHHQTEPVINPDHRGTINRQTTASQVNSPRTAVSADNNANNSNNRSAATMPPNQSTANQSQTPLPTGRLPQTSDQSDKQPTILGVLMSALLALAGALGFKKKKQKK